MAHRSLRVGDLVTRDRKCTAGGISYHKVNSEWCYATISVVPVNFVGIVVDRAQACDPLLDRQIELVGVLVKDALLYFARVDLRRLYAINWTL